MRSVSFPSRTILSFIDNLIRPMFLKSSRRRSCRPAARQPLFLEPLEQRNLLSPVFQLLNDGKLQESMSGGPWTTIPGATSTFKIDSNGVLYELETTGALWRLSGNTWAKLDSGVGMIQLAPNNVLYDLETTGNLWGLSNGGWTQLDSGVSTINVDPNSALYELESNGNFWKLPVYGQWTSWTKITSQVSSFQMGASGFIAYQMQDGSIWFPSLPFTSIQSGLPSWFVDASNHVWGVSKGVLYEYSGSTQQNTYGAGGVVNAAESGDGDYVYYQDNHLYSSGVYEPPGNLYRIAASTGAVTQLDNNALSFGVAHDGTVYEAVYNPNGLNVYAPGSTSSTPMPGAAGLGPASLTIAPNGDVFGAELGAGDNIPSIYKLYSFNVDGTTLQAQGVNVPIQFQISSFGAVVANVEQSAGNGGWFHTLSELEGGVWTQLDGNVAFFYITGAAVAFAPNGALYELHFITVPGSIYQVPTLWRLTGNGWTELDVNVSYLEVANDGTLIDGDGQVWILNANGWKYLATGGPTLTTGWTLQINVGGAISYYEV